MTREEAILYMVLYRQRLVDSVGDLDKDIEAFDMAIKALEQETCEDAISRKDAEQMFRNIRGHLKPQDYKSAEEFNTRDLMLLNAEQMIHALPSVTQEPKMGHWIDIMVGDMPAQACDQCNTFYPLAYTGGGHKYCPNCGAKMEVGK